MIAGPCPSAASPIALSVSPASVIHSLPFDSRDRGKRGETAVHEAEAEDDETAAATSASLAPENMSLLLLLLLVCR